MLMNDRGKICCGTDIVQLGRIKNILNTKGEIFCRRILAEEEQEELLSLFATEKHENLEDFFKAFQEYDPRLASRIVSFVGGRYAAKEASLKAFGTGLSSNLKMNEIIIKKEAKGRPYLAFAGGCLAFVKANKFKNFALSLSHDGDYALAFVVCNKYEKEGDIDV